MAGGGVSVCELRTIPCRARQSYDDLTAYIILNDHGEFGIASEETDPAKADRETIIRNFLSSSRRPKTDRGEALEQAESTFFGKIFLR